MDNSHFKLSSMCSHSVSFHTYLTLRPIHFTSDPIRLKSSFQHCLNCRNISKCIGVYEPEYWQKDWKYFHYIIYCNFQSFKSCLSIVKKSDGITFDYQLQCLGFISSNEKKIQFFSLVEYTPIYFLLSPPNTVTLFQHLPEQ